MCLIEDAELGLRRQIGGVGLCLGCTLRRIGTDNAGGHRTANPKSASTKIAVGSEMLGMGCLSEPKRIGVLRLDRPAAAEEIGQLCAAAFQSVMGEGALHAD